MAVRQSLAGLPGLVIAVLLCLFLAGCMSPWFAAPDALRTEEGLQRDVLRKKLEGDDRPTQISQIASPGLLTQSPIENIGLVTRLHNTGGIVEASSQREKILDVMRRKEAEQPNAFLDAPSTSVVVATALVPPAARRGRKLDIRVVKSSHAEATDLSHGWLMETPLVEMSVLEGQLREGFDLAKAEGSIVTMHQITGDESPESKLSGVIVGGGRLLKQRELGISVDAEYADAITMGAIVPSINKRFTYFNGHKKSGIATPLDAGFMEIHVPKKYELDPHHFINVILRLGFNETTAQRAARVDMLKKQLREPTAVREACWQLEALGESSIPALTEVVDHPSAEIGFYAAHALAYLNHAGAIPRLKALALKEPAFRAMCLNALSVIESYEADDALRELLHAADPEVKYGALLALRRRDGDTVELTATEVGETGGILEVPSSGPPLVAVSLTRNPEVVIFGENPTLHIPDFQYVGESIIVSREANGQLKVSHFETGKDDQVIVCDADLRSVLYALSEAEANYGDWVQFLRECHEQGCFVEPFAMNPVPVSGRTFDRTRDGLGLEPGQEMYEDTFIGPDFVIEQEEKELNSRKLWNPLTWAGGQ